MLHSSGYCCISMWWNVTKGIPALCFHSSQPDAYGKFNQSQNELPQDVAMVTNVDGIKSELDKLMFMDNKAINSY